MPRPYSAARFLRCVPHVLLNQYLAQRGIVFPEAAWSLFGGTGTVLVEELERLLRAVRAQVESDFAMINDLACTSGVLAITDEAAAEGYYWSAQFAGLENAHARALWTFLNHPDVFRAAGNFH
jgi:hypothetical protein